MQMNVEEQYDKIYRYCYFKLNDQHIAEDLTQEAFLRYYKQDLHLDHARELPYLYTTARNLCMDVFRRKPMESIENLRIEPAYDPTREWTDTIALRALIAKLPGDEQELLFLRYGNELPVTAISTIMGLSRFAVYRRSAKVLKWLKAEWKKEGFDDEL